MIARFANLNPETQLQVRVGGTLELLELLASDRLDIVLGMGAEADPAQVRTAPTVWLGEPALADQRVLPIAILEEPCRFRDAALSALKAAGRPYRIVVETPSLSVLRAAIDSNLAVTARTEIFSTRVIAGEGERPLPVLPPVAYVRHVGPSPHPTLTRLSELIGAAVLEL